MSNTKSKEIQQDLDTIESRIKEFKKLVELLPEIKGILPDIVYCRDCRFWGGRYSDDECSLITMLGNPDYWLKTKPYDFCSSGERKSEDSKDM